MTSTVLFYAAPSGKKDFRCHTLIVGLICLLIVIAFDVTYSALEDPYFGPPGWVVSVCPWILVPTLLGPVAGLITFGMLTFRRVTPRRFPIILALTMVSIAGMFVLPCHPFDWRRDYAYMRLKSYICGLAQSCCVFAADHSGRFPPDPAVLILDDYMSPKNFVDVDIDPYVPPVPPPPESDWPRIAADLRTHSIFVYSGADVVSPPPPLDSRIIIAYTKPRRVLPRHHLLAFADGHAELVNDAALAKFFATSNAARAMLHLPPFALNGPPPLPVP